MIQHVHGKRILYLNFFAGRLWESISRQAMEKLKEVGCEILVWDVGRFRFPRTNVSSLRNFAKYSPKGKGTPCKYRLGLSGYLTSEAQTFFRWQNPRGLLYKIYVNLYSRRMEKFCHSMCKALEENSFDVVVIPNGRAAIMSIAKEICESEGVDVLYLETNSGFSVRNGRFFLEGFPIHSRIKRQETAAKLAGPKRLDAALFREWFSHRANSGNLFEDSLILDFGVSSCLLRKPDEPKWRERNWNIFFTSSSDEHWNAGWEWELDQWEDQYEAFGEIIECLKNMGENQFIVRVHPGLADKSPIHVRAELEMIRRLVARHPEVVVLGPTISFSAYELISVSRRVIVTMSTVGLEANGVGVPVWCTKPTDYDAYADVKKIWSKDDISPENLEIYKVNPSNAWGLFAGMYRMGYKFEKQTPRGHGSEKLRSILNADLPFRVISRISRLLGSKRSTSILRKSEVEFSSKLEL